MSSLERVRKCRRVSHGQDVAVERRENGRRASITNVQTCGSVHACPMCGARIRATRALEVAAALRSVYDGGGTAVLVTLTAPHRSGERLVTVLDRLQAVWHAGRNARRVKALWPAEPGGYVRGLDFTHGENGWHPHFHLHLCFPDRPSAERIEALRLAWTEAANKALGRRGDDLLHPTAGITAQILDLSSALESAAGYITKAGIESAAAEVAGGVKVGRGEGSRTPFQVLSDAITDGDERDWKLWWEYERETRGKRQLLWSRGFRSVHVLTPELTDEEIAAQTDHDGETLARFPQSSWKEVTNVRGRVGELLRAATASTDPEVAYLLVVGVFRAWGLPDPLPPDPPGQERTASSRT